MSNGCGNYPTSRENDMAAFDKLPPQVRFAFLKTEQNYAAAPIVTFVRKHGWRATVRWLLEDLDREAGQEAYRVYGPDHPQSNNFGRKLKRAQNAVW